MIALERKEDCCGCNACEQICRRNAIEMTEDTEGFLYPSVNEQNCADCMLCLQVCPVINRGEERIPKQTYAAYNPDPVIRQQSSSGGVFTPIAEYILDKKGVVFGARFNAQWEVVHDYVESADDLAVFRGSKYVQSTLGNTFREVKSFLNQKRLVLFSGVPCQIAALNLYLRKPYANLVTVGIVCHGVPSPKVWRKYLAEVKSRQDNVSFSNIQFRDKIRGWKNFSFTISSKSGKPYISEYLSKNIFLKGFLRNLYLRPSCHHCPSKSLSSGSDISLADYWGIDNAHPGLDDDKGMSLVLLNTDKAIDVFENLNLSLIESSYEKGLRGNSAIKKSCECHPNRKRFFSQLGRRPLTSLIDATAEWSTMHKIRRKLRWIIHTRFRQK